VRRPVASGIEKRVSRHITQEVCPWNSPKLVQVTGEADYRARPNYELRATNYELRDAGDEVAPGAGQVRSRSGSLPGTEAPSIIELLETALDEVAWDSFSRGSAIRRAGRAGFARNVCVGLGNWGSPEAVPVLARALRDEEPLIRGHAAWALWRIGSEAALQALWGRVQLEEDAWVREEIEFTLIWKGLCQVSTVSRTSFGCGVAGPLRR
jgi:hypothetical protein